jgi:hypothetical protein
MPQDQERLKERYHRLPKASTFSAKREFGRRFPGGGVNGKGLGLGHRLFCIGRSVE